MARRIRIGIVILILAAAGGVALYRSVPRPTPLGPTALVQVRSRPPAFPLAAAPDPTDAAAFRRSQLFLVRSTDVLNAALRVPAVQVVLQGQPDPVAWLATHLTAEFVPDTDLLKVGVTGLAPADAVKVLDAVVGNYVEHAIAADRKRLLEREERVRRLRDDLRTEANSTRIALRRMAEVSDGSGSAEVGRADLAALFQERTALRVAAAGVVGDAAREKAYAGALKGVEDRIRSAGQVQMTFGPAAAELPAIESAEAALSAELIRLRVERTMEPRVVVVGNAAVRAE